MAALSPPKPVCGISLQRRNCRWHDFSKQSQFEDYHQETAIGWIGPENKPLGRCGYYMIRLAGFSLSHPSVTTDEVQKSGTHLPAVKKDRVEQQQL